MNPGDVVRVLDDPSFGYGPLGHVFRLEGPFVKVAMDDPEHGAYHWFAASELEVVDVSKWEKATGNVA